MTDRALPIYAFKAFTAWLNSYLARRDLKIVDLQNDLQDGTLLNSFLEIITNKKMRRWTAKPNSKIKMLENLSFGLTYIQHDMGVKLVSIGSEDIYNGSLKLILGLVWSLLKGIQMRRFATEGTHSRASCTIACAQHKPNVSSRQVRWKRS